MRVLVIEDEEHMREGIAAVVKDRLHRKNLQIDKCQNRAEVVALLQAGAKFDFSIVDLILAERPSGYYTFLPEARGYEGIEIFEDHGTKLGKTIFITNSNTDRRVRAMWSGFADETVCLKDLPYGTPPEKDWPENLYAAIDSAAATGRDSAMKPRTMP